MTILTKPSTEKKQEATEIPLVEENELNNVKAKKGTSSAYVNVPEPDFLIGGGQTHGSEFPPQGSIMVLGLTALFLMGIGIVGGLMVYNQFARIQIHRMTGCCKIPYDSTKDAFFFVNSLAGDCDTLDVINSASDRNDNLAAIPHYFLEQFEIDPDHGNYEKIDVPNFREGKKGRFIHDFNINKTGIIDLEGKRCFVMPLNQKAVLPPRSLFDLVQKMSSGYYDVNMTFVKQNMKVVLPPIQDFSTVGLYIAKDCFALPTYELKPYEGKVVKRSADDNEMTSFTHFSGNGIQHLNIVNLNEVYEAEEPLKNI